MIDKDFAQMSIENLQELITEVEAIHKENWLGWFEKSI